MRTLVTALSAGLLGLSVSAAIAQNNQPKNLVLFVPDGLRALKVTPETAPTMAAIRDKGINFTNSHSLFPTFTLANASGMATGHYLGDSGIFSNTIYTGYPVGAAGGTMTPFLENDPVLGDIDEHFAGNYLNEETILKLARTAGYSAAAVGKLGPTLMFDHTERTGTKTITIDDQTGTPAGIPLSDDMKNALTSAGLPSATPARGDNGKAGDFKTPGATTANVTQQKFFADAITKAILPMFKSRGKPFIIVFWSRDPDGSQHNQGDSLNSVTPGINGPTSVAAIRNADDNLAQVRQALKDLGLEANTNIIVSADHGFSTISKESTTSDAAKANYTDVKADFLPPGFLAIDLAKALDLPLADPDDKNALVEPGKHPRAGNGLLGKDATKPDVVVAANGGSDLIYLGKKDQKLAHHVVNALLAQDYVSGIFVDDDLAPIRGTLRMSSLNLRGKAITPHPSIVVNFRSYTTGCDQPTLCTVEIDDTRLQQGQGMHGNFARSDTQNFMAAIGPDFKSGYSDPLPVSNADVGMTISRILHLQTPPKGNLVGRVLTETMPNGATPRGFTGTLTSQPSSNGLRTVLHFQRVLQQRYFDVAGFPGRTVGLDADKTAKR
jgi:hypothetical protein